MKGDGNHIADYMPWWLGDYRRDTGDLDCQEHGAYMLLLGELWSAGGYLPFEPQRLCRRIGLDYDRWNSVWSTISRFFTVFDGQISQKRCLYELGKARELRSKRSAAGANGATARWAVTNSKRIEAPLAKQCPQSQSQSDPDQTGKREDSLSSGVAASPPSPDPVLLVFPTARGKKSGSQEWHYTERLEAELRVYFPALDVRSAVLESLAWIKAHPGRRKTSNGMLGFLTGWLTRAQNRGQHVKAGGVVKPTPRPAWKDPLSPDSRGAIRESWDVAKAGGGT